MPCRELEILLQLDLEALGFTFGACVLVEGAGADMDGEWQVQDRMNKRWDMRIDFLVNKEMKYGKWKNVKLKLIN